MKLFLTILKWIGNGLLGLLIIFAIILVSVAYLCQGIDEEIQLNEEHSQYRFFDLQKLPENISPPIMPFIQDLVKKYIG